MSTDPNWAVRCALAQQNGFFTEKDCNLASDWSTCAIGENAKQSNLKPQDVWEEKHVLGRNDYRKLVNEANTLGMRFMALVQQGHQCPDQPEDFDPEYAKIQVDKAVQMLPVIEDVWNQVLILRTTLVIEGLLTTSEFDEGDEHEAREQAAELSCDDFGCRSISSNEEEED